MAPFRDSMFEQLVDLCYAGYTKEASSGNSTGSAEGSFGEDAHGVGEHITLGQHTPGTIPGADSGSVGGSGDTVPSLSDGTGGDQCGGSGGPVQDDATGAVDTSNATNPYEFSLHVGDSVQVNEAGEVIGVSLGSKVSAWATKATPAPSDQPHQGVTVEDFYFPESMALPTAGQVDMHGDTFSAEAIEQMKSQKPFVDPKFESAVYEAILKHYPTLPRSAGLKTLLGGDDGKGSITHAVDAAMANIVNDFEPAKILPEHTPSMLASQSQNAFGSEEPVIPRCSCGAQYRLRDITEYGGYLCLVLRCGMCGEGLHLPFRPKGDHLVGNQYDEVRLVYFKRAHPE